MVKGSLAWHTPCFKSITNPKKSFLTPLPCTSLMRSLFLSESHQDACAALGRWKMHGGWKTEAHRAPEAFLVAKRSASSISWQHCIRLQSSKFSGSSL